MVVANLKTAQDFINFFTAIPAEKWGVGRFFNATTGQCCARGLLGERNDSPYIPARTVLEKIFQDACLPAIGCINDATVVGGGYNPKASILAALELAKKKGL